MKLSEITTALERPISFWKEPSQHVKKLAQFGLLTALVGSGMFLVNETQAEEVALHTTSAKDIHVVPLVSGGVPDFSQGRNFVLNVPDGCEDDMTQPVKIYPLSKGKFVAVWWNYGAKKACYSHYTLSSNHLIELYTGTWFNGTWKAEVWTWEPPPPSSQLPSVDLNGDGIDDLVLIYSEYDLGQYKVALGRDDGSFDFSQDNTVDIFTGTMIAMGTVLADADSDGHLDLVYFTFASGGYESTDLYMLKGQGDGTFAPPPGKLLISTGEGKGSGSQAFVDLNEDGMIDIFFAPDDDGNDSGQAYAAFGTGPGTFGPLQPILPKDSTVVIDFDPNNEGWSSDGFYVENITLFDVNLDSHLDVIAGEIRSPENKKNPHPENPNPKNVYFGDGKGNFSFDSQTTLPVSRPPGSSFFSEGLVWMSVAPEVVLYTTSAKDIRVVPLVRGGMPDLTQGLDLVASADCEDDFTQPATIVRVNPREFIAIEFIAIWWNSTSSCYSRFTSNLKGGFTETKMGNWLGKGGDPAEYVPILNSSDLNSDKIDDLVLIHQTGQADNYSFQYQVALGKPDGSFDFTGSLSPPFITPPARGAFFNLVDADGDQCADLVFHSFPWGGDYSTTLKMLKGLKDQNGQCNGSFSETAQTLLSHGQGSTGPVFGDFKVDSFIDVFLPPDDDVSDLGQSYIALGTGPGTFAPVQPSIDFDPIDEGPTRDRFNAEASACDIDLDGYLDIVSYEYLWGISRTTKVYLGKGDGEFSTPGIQLFQSSAGQPHPTLTCGPLVYVETKPSCDVVAYVVHDGGLNDSLLLSVSNPNLQFTPIGSVHPGYDLEALALHPQTHVLYASSGENAGKRGYLYKVEGENVVELGQPGDFSGGLEGLSFNPSTKDLWGWAQGKGLVKFDKLEPPSASQVLTYSGEIQDLTWSPQGDVLYAVENRPQGGKNKVILWAYHPADGSVVAQCEKELEGWQEVEALQALPSGDLLFGLHNSKKLLTGTIDPNQGCQVSNIQEIPVPYDDIEGVALTACPLTM